MSYTAKPVAERFQRKYIVNNDGCWIWQGYCLPKGYGQFSVPKGDGKNRIVLAHRTSFELFRGVIPSGLKVCHTCDVPSCVNPAHLFLGDNTANMQDASRKGRLLTGEARAVCSRMQPEGSKSHNAKLTEDQVIAAREEYTQGIVSQHALASRLGITQSTLNAVLNRKTWKHV